MSIIVAFPKIEDAKNIRNVLSRNGFTSCAVCNSGAQVITKANELDEGIILCGYRLSDMHYSEVYNYLPKGFQMLLVASANKLEESVNQEIVCLSMPIKSYELISTLEMMTYQYNKRKKKEKSKPSQRTNEEKMIIKNAKELLIHRNNLSEEDAHRYIQKISMDSGTNMVETAEMILALQ